MKYIKQCCLLFLLPISLLYSQEPADSNIVKIRADDLFYVSQDDELVISSNVKLNYQNIQVESDHLVFNTESEIVEGVGDIKIKRDEVSFDSSYVALDLNKSEIHLEEVDTVIKPVDSQSNLTIRVQELTDKDEVKLGRKGYITSCSLVDPHYFLLANRFKFYPDKRLTASNVVIRNSTMRYFQEVSDKSPYLFWVKYGRTVQYLPPFNIWLPYYNYELGNRRYILQIPVFGKKDRDGWGWYVQNTIDYNRILGKDSSVYVDWYEYQGVGLGVKHQYLVQSEQNPGTLYLYHFKAKSEEDPNIKLEWDQTFKYKECCLS